MIFNSCFFKFFQECRDECESGMQLASEGECELCPRGTYRTRGVEPACQHCPVGRTTPKTGAATIEECSLPICLPGTVINILSQVFIEFDSKTFPRANIFICVCYFYNDFRHILEWKLKHLRSLQEGNLPTKCSTN